MLPDKIPYLIAETAFHHEGDKGFLIDLIHVATKSGADAVKFHLLFDVEDYMTSDHPGIETIRKISIAKKDWFEVFGVVNKIGIDIIALTNDVKSLQWINNQNEFQIRAIELHASGLNDLFLLKEASNFKGTIMLGVGGSTLDEIKYAVDRLKMNGKDDIFLMHGFQNYPTDFKDINLQRMLLLKEIFSLPIGYADHTDPNDPDNETISVLGVGNGCNVVEKHLTHRFGEKRIDHQAAVSADQFKKIKDLMKKVFMARGVDPSAMSLAEIKYGDTGPMKKAIVARVDIAKGTKIELKHLAFKRTTSSSSIRQKEIDLIVGSEAIMDISANEIVNFTNIKYAFELQDFSQFFVEKEVK